MKWLCPQCRQRYEPHTDVCPDDGTPLVEDRAGQSVGGCTLEALIGVGRGGSTVWEASRGDEPRVAVKVMPAADDDEREALQAAARSVAAVRHGNLVSIHGHGSTVDGHVYVIMELLEGVSLAERLSRDEPIPSAESLALVEQVLDALSATHREGLPHLELDPGDIFVQTTADGPRVKLLDVGLARPAPPPPPLAPADDAPSTGQFYRAPELLVSGRGDAASDLYSVGALLVHLLTGRPPYAGNAADLSRGHLSRRPPRLTERGVEPPLAESAQVVIDRLMAKQPGDRYSSAAEARLAVGGLFGAKPPAAVDDDGFLDEMEDSFQNLAAVGDPSVEREPLPPPPVDPTPPPRDLGPALDAPPPASGGGRWALVAVIALLAGVVVYLLTRDDAGLTPPPSPDVATAAVVADATAKAAPPVVDAAPPAPDAARAVDAAIEAVDAALPSTSRISSTPAGARLVLADGRVLGQTPFDGRLPADATRIEVQLDDHEPQVLEFDAAALERGGLERSLTLEKQGRKVDPAAAARWRERQRAAAAAKAEAAEAARRTREALAAEKAAKAGDDKSAEPEPEDPGTAAVDPPAGEKEGASAAADGKDKAAGGVLLLDRGAKTKGRTGRKGPRIRTLGSDPPSSTGGGKDGESKVDVLQAPQ